MSMHCIHEYFAHVITGTIIDTCDTCTVVKGAPPIYLTELKTIDRIRIEYIMKFLYGC